MSEEITATDRLNPFVKGKQEIIIGNYERTDLKEALRPYEAFMMRIK